MKANYFTGFSNHFSSEARPNVLPDNQNSPQKVQNGLYAEQLSGSAFTAPRSTNLFSWLYRIRPSVMHKRYIPSTELTEKTLFKPKYINPNQMRWNPLPPPTVPQDFVEGLKTICGIGSALEQRGLHIHLYAFNKNMNRRYVMNADGDFLIVLQDGKVQVKTELGVISAEPGEIVVVPRGMVFQINPLSQVCHGYVGENFGSPFRLPELGPIGANGLAHRRHFLTPQAAFEDLDEKVELLGKFSGQWWSAEMDHSPLNVVAWHGNYVPYKYDLRLFNSVNTVSYDHPDPSIFTVLTSPSDTAGVSNIDFVVFPPRWMVAEHTFRPPYFHRNCMSEYMGLIHGVYDAKTSGGFVPGGGSLHNFYSAHGPDSGTYEQASEASLKPHFLENTLAFMFESRAPYLVTDFAMQSGLLQEDYQDCWLGFKKYFK
ncbi:MAG: homogentisate 1,2-dioxygenase [Bdellovibrionaceae bacterium]|nr:homogentisate 1,2-dioxygenase [Pseudobdellovibrionaceae bacterium]